MANDNICAVCGEGRLHPEVSSNKLVIDGISYEVAMHTHWCDQCATKFATNADLRLNARAARQAKKTHYGLLTGEQVRQCRKNLGLNQDQAARLFGGGPVAFSKYENDEVIQSESMDRLIWLVTKFPSLMIPLAQHIEMQLPSGANICIEKVRAKFDEDYFFTTESDIGFAFNHEAIAGFETVCYASNDNVYQLRSDARPTNWKVA
jgi:HTH-type transcriptional regulator/antitoxin MqsA